MSMAVVKPGLFTTVQDSGRPGWRSLGVTAGGAMDSYALRAANLLAGNLPGAAGLEMTLSGAELEVQEDLLIAITGANMTPSADGEELPMWRPVWIRRGTCLKFGSAVEGCRTYLAAAGGIKVPKVLSGRGTDVRAGFGGLEGRPLIAGDLLSAGKVEPERSQWAARWTEKLGKQAAAEGRRWAAPSWYALPEAYAGGGKIEGCHILRVIAGAEYSSFTKASLEALFTAPYLVSSSSDRMGCRLTEGARLERTVQGEVLSRGIVPGTVQVPPEGQPIVLGADCQTTGGYPVIAHVISADLPLLAQLKPGDRVCFKDTGLEEAHSALLIQEAALRMLSAGLGARL
ncbi:5-oxoprolinase subunit C family protein [Paenibacillus tarimensis]|uniref:5-oxoprolinase subunit C family protein n=1 Tax=Paenibacillus tarimensis TaxID=416012 RepID=UPI001F4346F8|nr:biotin-dependent carboxyltransferase family protein [Paenibacillus tarimensis]MCF2942915.1 biotin-dependent carboxyltransferase family protein [Paenibacillus tarimensis]